MKYTKKHFTLIELLAAMGVFSVLLVLSMQFFTSAQRMWTSAESKNVLYSDSRLIMDLISSKLQTTHYIENMPFELEINSNGVANKIIFASREKLDSREKDLYNIRFLSFSFENNNNILRYQIISDNGDARFENMLPPYTNRSSISSNDLARTQIKNILSNNSWNNEERNNMILLDSVLDFSIRAYNPNNLQLVQLQNGVYTTPPYMFEISLTIMGKEAFNFWKKLPEDNDAAKERKNNYKLANSHTFKRNIYLSDRWANN